MSRLVFIHKKILTFEFVFLGVKDKSTGSGGPEFAQVFVVVWAGAAIVTLNSQLLGGHM